MISLFSESIRVIKSSNALNISSVVLGGLYQLLIKNGLAFGFEISSVIVSRLSAVKSSLIMKFIEVLMYIATPPPCLFLSFLTIS